MGREVEGQGRESGRDAKGHRRGFGSLGVYSIVYGVVCVCIGKGSGGIVREVLRFCKRNHYGNFNKKSLENRNLIRRTETPQISRIFFLVLHPYPHRDNRNLSKWHFL